MGKVYARAKKIPDEARTYLTAGKLYPVEFQDHRLFKITADNGSGTSCLWTGCPHLCGDNWTRVVQEVTESTPVITLGTVTPDTVVNAESVSLMAQDRFGLSDTTPFISATDGITDESNMVGVVDSKVEEPTQRLVCASCGGEDVTIDATASWDTEAKTWTLLSTDETNSWCEDCGGECSIDWIEVTE